MEAVHKSVLLDECLRILSPEGSPFEKDTLMIDCTQGEGGHSYAFLKAYPNLHVIGLDADPVIQERAKERLKDFEGRVSFRNVWFDEYFGDYREERRPNLILFDLGLSSYHYEMGGRGFSFRYDEALDMRLNPGLKQTASDVVNTMSEKALSDLIFEYSEERYSRSIAKRIVEARRTQKIRSSKELADIVYSATPAEYHRRRVRPATKTFMALRIYVNGELERLRRVLPEAFGTLLSGGKMAFITFHSLEDRIVKNYFRDIARAGCADILTKHVVMPSAQEKAVNAASRSARLRAVRRCQEL